jgi:hypothetical protein
MPEAVMQGGFNLADPTAGPALEAWVNPLDVLAPAGYIGSRTEIEKELDLIAAAIRTFYRKQPDMVMKECAGFSARLTEMAVLLHRVEGLDRQYTRIRTQQVERFLSELDRQFKTASRLIEVQRQDIALMGGQV